MKCGLRLDGRVVSGGMDSKLCLWQIGGSGPSSRCEDLVGHSGSISLVKPLNEVNLLSSSYDKTLRIWDASSDKRASRSSRERSCLKGHVAPILDFSIWGGQKVVSGDRDGSVLVFDLEQGKLGKKLKTAHQGHCTSVLGSTESASEFYSGGQDGCLRVWDIRSKEVAWNLQLHVSTSEKGKPNGCGAVSFIQEKDNFIITAGADGRVNIVDKRQHFRTRSTYTAHKDFIYSLHLYNDLCFSGSGDGMLLVHDFRTDTLLYGLGANQAAVRGIVSTKDQLICAGDDGSVIIYDMAQL